jgi:predicted N-acetyltransferase YhbS
LQLESALASFLAKYACTAEISNMSSHLKIVPLADVPNVIPVLEQLFVQEWEPYYGAQGPGDAARDLAESCQRDELPFALVAIDADGKVAGTAALKTQSVGSDVAPGPWLAAFVVQPGNRRQGIGDALVGAIEREAKRLGLASIFVSTDAAEGIIQRRGWRRVGAAASLRGEVAVYSLDLSPSPSQG